jgi:hypothetical protein
VGLTIGLTALAAGAAVAIVGLRSGHRGRRALSSPFRSIRPLGNRSANWILTQERE